MNRFLFALLAMCALLFVAVCATPAPAADAATDARIAALTDQVTQLTKQLEAGQRQALAQSRAIQPVNLTGAQAIQQTNQVCGRQSSSGQCGVSGQSSNGCSSGGGSCNSPRRGLFGMRR